MASEQLIFGLAQRHYSNFVEIFRSYPQIEQVLIFGSRAKGTDKPWSDFDLAVEAPEMSDQDFSRLWSEIDSLPLAFKIDLIHLNKLGAEALRDRINKQGQFFYPQSMERFLETRQAIYDQFHDSDAGPGFFFKNENQDRYAAYYTSMYLLQDTAEALWQHRQQGFSKNALAAYLEYWGVMQALFVQQDALGELFKAIIGNKLETAALAAWQALRNLRNQSAGHPAIRDRGGPLTRTFMGRNFGDYAAVTMEVWNAEAGNRAHPRHNLAVMVDAYEKEAAACLREILQFMQYRWPLKGDE